jgi:hypothetical protein
MSHVKLISRGVGRRPPPFTDLLFDVEAANTGDSALWFVLPLYLETPPAFGPLLASSVEISEFRGAGAVRLARFLGNGSFQLLCLAAGARVKLDGLPMTVTGEVPAAALAVPMMSARELRIGDQLAETWLSVDLLVSSNADASYEPGAIVASQDTPGVRPLPVQLAGVRAWASVVKLGGR